MRNLMLILGDLTDTVRLLERANRTVEANVIERISDILTAEIDPYEAALVQEADGLDPLNEWEPEMERMGATLKKKSKPMTSSQKMQMRRKMKLHRPRPKKWLCCTQPIKKMTRGKTHKPMWFSTCRYQMLSGKLRGQTRSMTVVIGRDPAKKPKAVWRNKKKIRWCSGAMAVKR